jgi:hypothetical protein
VFLRDMPLAWVVSHAPVGGDRGRGRLIAAPTFMQSTMSDPKTKSARLKARITPELQALLKRAAELEGRSVTGLVAAPRAQGWNVPDTLAAAPRRPNRRPQERVIQRNRPG